ncbi:Chromatin assembly factor 1 subunit A family protein [Acanthocheilonema viteae]
MDVNGDHKENKETEVKNHLTERCSDRKVQRYNDEVIADEVSDFVREVVDAVAYTIDRLKTSSRRGKHAPDEVIEISDTDSITGNPHKKKVHGPIRRYRKLTVKQLAEQEKRMRERRRIAAKKMKNCEAAVEGKKLKKEEAQKERERRKKEREELREKKRKENLQRKERKKKEEEEKKQRKRVEEEVRKQKKEKEEQEREKKRRYEEERREMKRRKEEVIELKKKRQSDRFLSFFDKRRETRRESEAVQTSSVLNVLPFFCKQGVSLAPIFRRKPLSKEVHDSLLLEVQPIERLYLSTVKPRTVEKIKLNRAKLFQFHDNWRPPYYGTWRKRSAVITGRKPFAKDIEILDYEVDSDEEWEIPEGDDCDESTMSEEEEDSDQSTGSDGFIVQHGYLSEGEGEDEQDRLERREDSNKRAERLRAVANEWKRSLEQKSKKFNKPLIPILWGPHFKLPTKRVPRDVEEPVFFEYSDDDDDIEDYYDNNDGDGSGSSDSCHDDISMEN